MKGTFVVWDTILEGNLVIRGDPQIKGNFNPKKKKAVFLVSCKKCFQSKIRHEDFLCSFVCNAQGTPPVF